MEKEFTKKFWKFCAEFNDKTKGGTMSPPTRIEKQEIDFAPDENTFGLKVFKERWQTKHGEKVYWKYGLPDSVQVMGVTPDHKIIGITEFQPSVGKEYFHLVGETMEQNENLISAARRGLLEETGYWAGSVDLLSSILENSGRSDRLIHLVLAVNCEKNGIGEKDIKVKLVEPLKFWDSLLEYLMIEPSARHGAGNTLKLTVLAFHKLGWLNVNIAANPQTKKEEIE